MIAAIPITASDAMPIKPSNKTAAAAGLWSSLGLVPLEGWTYSTAMQSFVWLAVLTVFLFVPFMFLVLGKDRHRFSRNWVNDPVERAQYVVMVKRMLCWLACAAAGAAMIMLLMRQTAA